MRFFKRFAKFSLIFVAIGAIGGWLALYYVAPRMLLVPHKAHYRNRSVSAEIQPFSVTTFDGLNLAATEFSSSGAHYGTVILCHGIGSCKENMYRIADWLASEGFDAIALDQRAHGESGGEYCTYGFLEKRDLGVVIDRLEDRGEENIVVLGISMGGAVALQALDFDDRIDGAVAISTFSSLREVSLDYQERITGLDWQWLNDFMARRAEEMSGFVVDSIDVEAACRRIDKPVFIAHGTRDSHITPEYAQRNFDALSSTDKTLYLVEGANHHSAWRKGGDELKAALSSFLSSFKISK